MAAQHQVFISYSFDDQQSADAICRHLERQGIDCWIAPRNITPGQNFAAAIIEAINQTDLLLVIFSSRLNRSNHAVREIERAVSKGLNILPILIEEVSPTGSYEYLLCNLHWLNASQSPLEMHLDSILRSAQLFLNPQQSAGQPFPPGTCNFPGSEPEFELEVLDADGALLQSVPIQKTMSIGRTQGEVVLNDEELSRQHCTIHLADHQLTVQDLESRNGVYLRVNGKVELRDQDEISIGTQIFRIEEIDD